MLRSVAEFGGYDFQFSEMLIGGVAIKQHGSPLPTATLDAALDSDAVLLGAVGGNEFNPLPPDRRPEAGLLGLRQALGGFANLRPSFAWPALPSNSPLKPEVVEGADILFVRELLGGLYFGEPRQWDREKNSAWNTMRYTRDEVVRVARVAFELAAKRRKKVTSVDKANVLEVSQLWRATVTEVAQDYPGHRAGSSIRRRLRDAPDEHAAQLRRGRDRKPLRRHPLRRSRRHHRLARHAAVGDHRRHSESVRAGTWLRAGHRRQRAGQSARRDPDRGDAAAPLRRASKRMPQRSKPRCEHVLEQGYRTADLARGNTPGVQVVSRRRWASRCNEALNQIIDRSQALHAV